MLIDAVSGAGWIGLPASGAAALGPAIGGVQSAQGMGTTQGPAVVSSEVPGKKPSPPFIKVPTVPLTPTVLAELVGRQPPLGNPITG